MDGRVVLVALGMSVTGPPAGEPLPATELAEPTQVFGSLREYFEDVSGGRFTLQVRIINPQDARGYPRWVQLNRNKSREENIYWEDAHDAAMAAMTARPCLPLRALDQPHGG